MIVKGIALGIVFHILNSYNSLLPENSWVAYLPVVALGYMGRGLYSSKESSLVSFLKIGLYFIVLKSLVDLIVMNFNIGLNNYMQLGVIYFCLLGSVFIYSNGILGIGFFFQGLYHFAKESCLLIISPFSSLKNLFKKRKEKFKNLSLEKIDSLGNYGKLFEEFTAELFDKLGYDAKTTTELRKDRNLPSEVLSNPGSGEYGADVIVFPKKGKKLTFKGIETQGLIVQCKQYGPNTNLGVKEIQEPYGAIPMYSNHFKRHLIPVLLTNKESISEQGIKFAKSTGVILINRSELYELMLEANYSQGE